MERKKKGEAKTKKDGINYAKPRERNNCVKYKNRKGKETEATSGKNVEDKQTINCSLGCVKIHTPKHM